MLIYIVNIFHFINIFINLNDGISYVEIWPLHFLKNVNPKFEN